MQKVKCSGCGKESDLALKTKALAYPFEDVLEVFIECPHCKLSTLTHYLSPALVQKQLEIRQAVNAWRKRQIRLNFNRLVKVREEYSLLFNREQKRYRQALDIGVTSELEKVGESNG